MKVLVQFPISLAALLAFVSAVHAQEAVPIDYSLDQALDLFAEEALVADPEGAVALERAAGNATTPAVPARRLRRRQGALRNPFARKGTQKISKFLPNPSSIPACAAPQPSVRGVVYKDKNSKVIPALKKQNDDLVRPFDETMKAVTSLSDLVYADPAGSKEFADRAYACLESWAKADAMREAPNFQGALTRMWTLGSLGAAFLKMKDLPGFDTPERKRQEAVIGPWMLKVAKQVVPQMDSFKLGNNLDMWTGHAAMVVGVATNDQGLKNVGVEKYKLGTDAQHILANGVMPREDARQDAALLYHQFCMNPLVAIAEYARFNGINLYETNGGSIHRTAKLLNDAWGTNKSLKSFNGRAMQETFPDLAFTVAYCRSNPGKCPQGSRFATESTRDTTAHIYTFLGGSQKLVWGRQSDA
ncbi:hypothetical protein HK102_006990 [Quaeritorhiza haematococci]|nr:hypothetical protein HK102_006990 [Quaeritorhiza haematococci]